MTWPEPGVLQFAKPSFVIKETGLKALLPVVRLNGADGHVSVKWHAKVATVIFSYFFFILSVTLLYMYDIFMHF